MVRVRASRGSLERLIDRVSPGGRLVRSRRLRGGLGSWMHVLDLRGPDGSRSKVVLRRFASAASSTLPEGHPFKTPEHATYEFELLRLLEKAGIAAPRPLLLDAQGENLDVPTMLLSYLPGRPIYPVRNLGAWLEGLASALLSVHSITPVRFDLSWLHTNLRDGMRAEIERRREQVAAAEPLAKEVHAALCAEVDRVEWLAATLVHDDYWPGNTVWHRGRLAGIVDWTSAVLGDPRADVCQCRLDLVLSHGPEVAGAFLEAYESGAACRLPDVRFFDLFRGLRALLYYEHWLDGYHDAGLTHLTSAICGERIRTFLRAVLDTRPR